LAEQRTGRDGEEQAPHVLNAPDIAHERVDQDALRVISRLQRHGHEAYLVGGCVRDLLLGRRPKDFDVATSAHPRQVKRLFRNGRIIGRRFRLVHVVYGRHIIETATFRAAPEEEDAGNGGDLLITEDNVYGTAAEDARRRDFTVNGLFYDPARDRVLDWVGGLDDLDAGVLRTIGEPRVRMAEDPVRILRAIKFATRLGFRIDDETWEAMQRHAGDLSRSAAPRVVEELLRLLRSGTALGAFRMLRASGALAELLPDIEEYLGARDDPDPAVHDRADLYWRLLEALDADVHAGNKPSTPVCLAVLYLRVIEREMARSEEANGSAPDLAEITERVLEPLTLPARVSRRILSRTRTVLVNQKRFTQSSTRNFSPLLFLRGEDFPESLHLFRLRSAAWGQGWDLYEAWQERYQRALEVPDEELDGLRKQRGGRRRRSRRRRRRRPRNREKD
jgi:poly(A) polymerase